MEEIMARCMKCKEQKKVKNPVGRVTKNGMWMIGGTCFDCGTKMSKILRKATDEDKVVDEVLEKTNSEDDLE